MVSDGFTSGDKQLPVFIITTFLAVTTALLIIGLPPVHCKLWFVSLGIGISFWKRSCLA